MTDTRIILCGRAASGKDTLRKVMQRRGFKFHPSYTSRPPRPTETDGIDYHFIPDDEFVRKIAEGYFYEHMEFYKSWKYGTAVWQWNTPGSVFIMTPGGIASIRKEDRPKCLVIYLDADRSVIEERLRKRIDSNDTVERRMASDDESFRDFTDYDVKLPSWEMGSDLLRSLI